MLCSVKHMYTTSHVCTASTLVCRDAHAQGAQVVSGIKNDLQQGAQRIEEDGLHQQQQQGSIGAGAR